MMSNVEWNLQGGYARNVKQNKETHYLEFGGIDYETFESFSGYVYIRKAHEACMAGKWVAVPQNPFVEYHDTKVITGSSPSVVIKKVLKQVERWKEDNKHGKEQGEHKVQEQSTGEEDCIPF